MARSARSTLPASNCASREYHVDMVSSSDVQVDLFPAPTFVLVSELLRLRAHGATIVIGCGRRKANLPAEAQDLYMSKRFRAARRLSEALDVPYLILSARHGIVAHREVLDPYDIDIKELGESEQRNWASASIRSLRQAVGDAPVALLATRRYVEPILAANAQLKHPLEINAPLAQLEEHHHQAWLEQAITTACRLRDLQRFYSIIESKRKDGKTFALGALSEQKLPPRGVYVFLDGHEPNFIGTGPRIVRIGTHAISRGSRSTLRGRLRNHLGLSDGGGNHRGSIFRLHVGRALLHANNSAAALETWGSGQDAPREVLAAEAAHERLVTEYLKQLEVFVIPVDDEPSKDSLRAAAEAQLIALLTEGLVNIDVVQSSWLGHRSPMKLIAKSGLWNVRDVGRRYDADAKGSVSQIATICEEAHVP
jgi:hypothetical protein